MFDTVVRALRALVFVAAATAIALPITAAAQSDDSVAIDEIIVTSRYRAEKLSDVPDSITAFTVADIERYGFDARPRFEAILAFAGEQAVGLAVFFYEFSTWRGLPGVYVQDLYVAPGVRGRGVGRQLIDAVQSRAAEWGGRYVKLSVYDANPGALGF